MNGDVRCCPRPQTRGSSLYSRHLLNQGDCLFRPACLLARGRRVVDECAIRAPGTVDQRT